MAIAKTRPTKQAKDTKFRHHLPLYHGFGVVGRCGSGLALVQEEEAESDEKFFCLVEVSVQLQDTCAYLFALAHYMPIHALPKRNRSHDCGKCQCGEVLPSPAECSCHPNLLQASNACVYTLSGAALWPEHSRHPCPHMSLDLQVALQSIVDEPIQLALCSTCSKISAKPTDRSLPFLQ